MKKLFIIFALVATGLSSSLTAKAAHGDAPFQVVIFSDGHRGYLPADWPQEFVNWYIDAYEDYLDAKRRYDSTPKPYYC
jgi:hypothetical protein